MRQLTSSSVFALLMLLFSQTAYAQRNQKEYYDCYSAMITRPTASGSFAEAASNAAKCETDTRAHLRPSDNQVVGGAVGAPLMPTAKGYLTNSAAATTAAGMPGQRCTYMVNGRSVQTLVQGLCPITVDFQ